jgi:outer membrane protein OmpA-like peptidoglycan-associated protein
MQAQAEKHREELRGILKDHQAQLAALQSGNKTRIQQTQDEASKRVAELEEKLSLQAKDREEAERREAESQARYKHVRALFEPNEADVFRQGTNVLIRLKGFQFRPGKAEIESKNFALLNKVLSALNLFPEGKVTVTGHTDSTGSSQTNLALSAERAGSVAQFLTTVGKFPVDQLVSQGRGEEEPIASNETPNGRASNRRIDVSITN